MLPFLEMEKRDASFGGNSLEVILGYVEFEMFIRIEMLRG